MKTATLSMADQAVRLAEFLRATEHLSPAPVVAEIWGRMSRPHVRYSVTTDQAADELLAAITPHAEGDLSVARYEYDDQPYSRIAAAWNPVLSVTIVTGPEFVEAVSA